MTQIDKYILARKDSEIAISGKCAGTINYSYSTTRAHSIPENHPLATMALEKEFQLSSSSSIPT